MKILHNTYIIALSAMTIVGLLASQVNAINTDAIYQQDELYTETVYQSCGNFYSYSRYNAIIDLSQIEERWCTPSTEKIAKKVYDIMPRIKNVIRKKNSSDKEKLATLKKMYQHLLDKGNQIPHTQQNKKTLYALVCYFLWNAIDIIQTNDNLVNQSSLVILPQDGYLVSNNTNLQEYNFITRRLLKDANVRNINQNNVVGRIEIIETQRDPIQFLDSLRWVESNRQISYISLNDKTTPAWKWKYFEAPVDGFWYVLQKNETYIYIAGGVGERGCFTGETCIDLLSYMKKIQIK